MKTFFLIGIWIFVLCLYSFGQAKNGSSAALKETLVSLEKQSWEAWKDRDGKFYQSFLSDDHQEIGAGGVTTKSQIVPFVGSNACVVKSYSVDSFAITVFNKSTALPCGPGHNLRRFAGAESGLGKLVICQTRKQMVERPLSANACT
jgi:uncharacterized protein DUF4440